jgi:hypothetical protein
MLYMIEHIFLNMSPNFQFKIPGSFQDIKVKVAVCAHMFGRLHATYEAYQLNVISRKFIFITKCLS